MSSGRWTCPRGPAGASPSPCPRTSAVFETNALWVNPTPFSQSYYAWSCAAVKTADDLRYIFPGRWSIGHDYSVPLEPWPVDRKGRDLSCYRNNAFPGSKSYFTVGEYEDFYGGWYEKADAGFGHWSRYEDMPGRKVWIWDLSRSGEIWVDLLTDKDGQYTEPQAGRLLNQSDHGDFPPGAADRWQELWFPYRGIGPMAKASPHAVLSAARSGDTPHHRPLPPPPVTDELTVKAAGQEVFRERLVLKPEQVWKKDVPLAGAAADAGARSPARRQARLRERSEGRRPRTASPLQLALRRARPRASTSKPAASSARRRLAEALDKYLAAIDAEPLHVRALARAAELSTRRGEPARALDYAGRALAVSMYDAEANYVYGVAARRLGRLVDAKETLGWAARSAQFKSVAHVQIGRDRRPRKGLRAGRGICPQGPRGRRPERQRPRGPGRGPSSGRPEGRSRPRPRTGSSTSTPSTTWPGSSATSSAGTRETSRPAGPSSATNCRTRPGSRWPCSTSASASSTTPRPPSEAAPVHPTVLYTLAYLLRDSSPSESAAWLEKASAMSPLPRLPLPRGGDRRLLLGHGGPAGRLEAQVLSRPHPLGQGPSGGDAGPLRDVRERRLRPLLHRPGLLLRERRSRPGRRGLSRRPSSSTPGVGGPGTSLSRIIFARGRKTEALAAARQAAADFPAEVPLQVDLAEALLAVGQPAEAAAVLDAVAALPYEGASDIHGLYVRAHVAIGLAAMKKGGLGRRPSKPSRNRSSTRKSSAPAPPSTPTPACRTTSSRSAWTGWARKTRPRPCARPSGTTP